MKTLLIPILDKGSYIPGEQVFHHINVQPWNDVDNCLAKFSINHYQQGICIHYKVCESFLNVRKRPFNNPTFKDNCVELFIAFNSESSYYNFELNCLGSIKGAFGSSRSNRTFLSHRSLQTIQDSLDITLSNTGADGSIEWDLILYLDLKIFTFHQLESLSGLTAKVNFTKCGDDLPNQHYLSWMELPSPTPDFHQPESFGDALFE